MPRRVKNWLRRVKDPAGARKRRKASVKKRRNKAPGFKALDPILLNSLYKKGVKRKTYLRST